MPNSAPLMCQPLFPISLQHYSSSALSSHPHLLFLLNSQLKHEQCPRFSLCDSATKWNDAQLCHICIRNYVFFSFQGSSSQKKLPKLIIGLPDLMNSLVFGHPVKNGSFTSYRIWPPKFFPQMWLDKVTSPHCPPPVANTNRTPVNSVPVLNHQQWSA